MGRALQRLKVPMPLFKNLEVRPNLRKLVNLKCNLLAAQKGELVKIPKGARVRTVSRAQAEAEVRVYESTDIDDTAALEKKLEQLRLSARAKG